MDYYGEVLREQVFSRKRILPELKQKKAERILLLHYCYRNRIIIKFHKHTYKICNIPYKIRNMP